MLKMQICVTRPQCVKDPTWLHVHTCSGRNRIIPLMPRPNTDSTPNKPVTLPRNQLLITLHGHESHTQSHDTLLRYAVKLQACTHPNTSLLNVGQTAADCMTSCLSRVLQAAFLPCLLAAHFNDLARIPNYIQLPIGCYSVSATKNS